MSYRVIEENRIKTILALYTRVFEDDLDIIDFEKRAKGYRIFMFIITIHDDVPIGFSLYRAKSDQVELWQAGVLEEYRYQGAGKELLRHGEVFLADLGYTKMTVNTYNHWKSMLMLLISRGYRIVSTKLSERREDVKISFSKELVEPRELRYSLTEQCNIDCQFCHNEGLGAKVAKKDKFTDKQVLDTLKQAVELGYTDITFTGGEPLIRKDRLVYLLNQLSKVTDPPYITLVTNGILLDEVVINVLREYTGRAKIHLSLHASTEEKFKDITQTKIDGLFQKVISNISKAVTAGLTVKVNQVILRGVNHTEVVEFIELVHGMGATTVKFIELLLLPTHKDDYRYFYDVNSIEKQIEEVASRRLVKNRRQTIYTYTKDPDFKIEVQRCTCAIGCSHCREVRDKTLSSDLKFHPCFIRSNKRYSISDPLELENIFRKGDRIIDGFARKYEESSPSLILREEEMKSSRIDFFFALSDVSNFTKYLEQEKYEHIASSGFHEVYYWPQSLSKQWTSFQKELKFGWELHKTSDVVDLIYTDCVYVDHEDIGLETHVKFLSPDGPIRFSGNGRLIHFLESLEMKKHFELDWKVEIWQRIGVSISVSPSTIEGKSTIKIEGRAEEVRSVYKSLSTFEGDIKPLHIPLIAFMKEESIDDQRTQ